MPDHIEKIPWSWRNEYTPDGIPLTTKEQPVSNKRRQQVYDETRGASKERQRLHARMLRETKKAIRDHIKRGGLVTSPDALAENIVSYIVGDE